MKSLCCNETLRGGCAASEKKERVNARARLGLCARSLLHLNQIKGTFPTFKRPRFTFILAFKAVSIKHMVRKQQPLYWRNPLTEQPVSIANHLTS